MTVRREQFVGAPADSYVSDEGWLVYGEEAWTLGEWLAYPFMRPIGSVPQRGRPAYSTDAEREEAKRQARRAWKDRNPRRATA